MQERWFDICSLGSCYLSGNEHSVGVERMSEDAYHEVDGVGPADGAQVGRQVLVVLCQGGTRGRILMTRDKGVQPTCSVKMGSW